MAKQHMRVEGLSDLLEALDELPKATGRAVQKRAMIKALEPMEAQAEGLAPRLTGELKAGFQIGTKLSRRQMTEHRREFGTTPFRTENGWRSNPTSTQFVFMGPRGSAKSIVQEFGSATQGPHPYMRPAWDGNKMTAFDSLADDLRAELDKTVKRIAARAAKLKAKA